MDTQSEEGVLLAVGVYTPWPPTPPPGFDLLATHWARNNATGMLCHVHYTSRPAHNGPGYLYRVEIRTTPQKDE